MFRWMNAMDFIIWDIWFSHEYDRRINSKREYEMEEQEEKKRIELGTGHVLEMYQILTITACIAKI